jgi:hypothetical protein
MRYQLPQFINVEDKVFGPFSFKQFLYLGGSAGIGYVLYTLLPLVVAIPLIVAVASLGLALAFYKVNSRPFIFLIQAFIKYLFKTKIYLWRKRPAKKITTATQQLTEEEMREQQQRQADPGSQSKLKELAWSLDVLDLQQGDSNER